MKITTCVIFTIFAVTCASSIASDKKSETKNPTSTEVKTDSSESSSSMSSSVNNGKGTVKYNDKEVWKGKVKKQLFSLAESVDGKACAAAFDGKKLEPRLKKLLRKLPKN